MRGPAASKATGSGRRHARMPTGSCPAGRKVRSWFSPGGGGGSFGWNIRASATAPPCEVDLHLFRGGAGRGCHLLVRVTAQVGGPEGGPVLAGHSSSSSSR